MTLGGVLLACGLGVPIPEDVSIITGGYLAHLGVVSPQKILLVCFSAVLGGDLIAFSLGRYFGRRILTTNFARRFLTARKQLRVRAYFRKYGSKVILIGRFLPGLRSSIFFSAGMLHVRPAVFLLWDSLAALVSVPTLVYLAFYFGGEIDVVVAWARRSEYGFLAVGVVAATFIVWRVRRRGRRHQITADPTLPPAASSIDNGSDGSGSGWRLK